MPEEVRLDDELKEALKEIVISCEKEDDEIRKSQIRTWKKNEEFWHGIQYLFWSEKDEAWRSPLNVGWDDDLDADIKAELGSFSDRVVDIFRGHGESIIAALSAQIPSLRFLPDDADSESDVLTARCRSKIADLVQRHNKAKLIFVRALFFLAIHGVVASYRYKDSDFKYGSYKVPEYGSEESNVPSYICGTCGYESDQDWTQAIPDANSGQQQPFEYDNAQTQTGCPQCGSIDPPEIKTEKKTVPILLSEKEFPKTRVKIDIFGPLHWKVSYYARSQNECSYFLLYGDQGKDVVKFNYSDFAKEIEGEGLDSNDRFTRSEHSSDPDSQEMVTVIKAWLRPAAFYRDKRDHITKKLLKKFPDGARVTFIGKNKIFIDAVNEDFDSRWEIGQAGLSTFIHSDPILRPLVPIQEMRNQVVNLTKETIDHGIPSEFADPSVLNFDQYGKFEAMPGNIYKTKPIRPGEPIGNSFYTSARATLSREVGGFIKQLDQDGQFCVGAFPSIYGGPAEGKTRTAAEYSMSRQMALQRLSIIWNLVTDWWVRTVSGSVDLFVEIIVQSSQDEKFTKYENGNYVNVWIRQSELEGKVGGVEPEGSETFPVSLAQKKDLLLKLMEMNNPYVNEALYKPENARVLQDVMALNEFKLPGESDRVKQVIEINELLKGPPISPIESTVPPEPDIDDAQVHIETIKAWALDTIGLDSKRVNPDGYANVMAHLKQHQMNAVMSALGPAGGGVPPGQPGQAPSNPNPNNPQKEQPVSTGANNG